MPTVLVVEDDAGVRYFIADILEDAGFEVVTAPDGDVALEQARDHPPDVIVRDYLMPRCDGPTFAAAYRQTLGPLAPIVLLTAVPSTPQRAIEVGAAAYLGKPFDVVDLIALVARYAER